MFPENKKLNQWENINIKTNQYQLETQSPAMQEVMDQIERVSATDANVLLLGENEPENMFWQSTFTNYRKGRISLLFILIWEVFLKIF
jgi:hypothetical protein